MLHIITSLNVFFVRLLFISFSFYILSQKVTYLFCDWLNIDSKVLIGRVRQATRDVVKSEV